MPAGVRFVSPLNLSGTGSWAAATVAGSIPRSRNRRARISAFSVCSAHAMNGRWVGRFAWNRTADPSSTWSFGWNGLPRTSNTRGPISTIPSIPSPATRCESSYRWAATMSAAGPDGGTTSMRMREATCCFVTGSYARCWLY